MKYDLSKHENPSALMIKKETGEILTPTQKVIVRLKAVKEARKLSIPDIDAMINHAVSRSTLYRFFEEESELHYNFDYQYTILPIQNALLVEDTLVTGDAIAKEKVAGFEAALQQREETIESLRMQIEQMKITHDKSCRDYEDRLAKWQNQINIKDERMDHKDSVLDEKDKEIRLLRERVDQLMIQLMEQKDQLTNQLLAQKDQLISQLQKG